MEAHLLYILWGKDDFSLEEALLEIKKSLGEDSLLSTNTNVLDGQKLSLNELKSVGGAMPFLSTKRLVIIKGLLERFEPKDKTGRPKTGKGSNLKTDESQLMADSILGFPESTILVLVDSLEIRKTSLQNNPLFKAVSGKAEIKQFPPLKGPKLSQWIQNRVAQKSSSISVQATSLLVDTIGGDLFTMSNEIDKLVAYTGSRKIEERDIRAVVSASQEGDIFAMVDAIIDHKAGMAEQILQKLFQNGRMPQQILGLLARQVQMLIQIKELKSQKRPSAEIQSRLGIFNPFAWDKILKQAEKYTMSRLSEIYQSLLVTDLSIKTGRLDGDLALILLIADLCNRKNN
jgi:DNA polymerase III subunit delta